jgi:cyclopropane fatty-acyl-phospholipid synthase-like methyltransferase
MGLDTNELDTRCHDRNRTNKTLREWEYQQELEHNREEEFANMDDEEIERYESYQATCGRCRYRNNRIKCSECEV